MVRARTRGPCASSAPAERRLGAVPHLVVADPLLGPGRELEPRLEAEQVVDEEAEVEAADHLLLDLLLGAEDVGVVLGDVPHPQQAVQRAARLVAVHEARLGVADRQVAVGAQLGLVDLHVRRAVHGLQAHGPLLDLREVHVVAELVPVARLLPELDVVEDRRLHLAVAARRRSRLRQSSVSSFQMTIPAGCQKGEPGRELAEHEQVELAAELAVVARARLLEALEVLLEVLLREEGGAVDAGEHLAVGVAAPVGARDARELERLDGALVVGACGPRQRSVNGPLR